MAEILLGRADYHRTVAKEARIQTRNRFFETNPVLNEKQTALISRPGLRRWLAVGAGPIRGIYSQPGSFNDALFVVSGDAWYRVDKDGTITLITVGIAASSASMAGTGTIGTGSTAVPEFMYLADGRNLWLYTEKGYAKGTISGSPANGDVVQIGTTYYQFTTGSVNAGTPAGTVGNPYLVLKGFNDAASWTNLSYAISAAASHAGVEYSTALTVANTLALVYAVAPTSLSVRAKATGIAGNGIATTETGASIAWTDATLTGGGSPSVTTVQTPDDVGVISVAYIASYVVVVPAQGAGINGRFFWINPGETTIDPLDFATAERSPDPIYQVVVFGDQFWLPGSKTTEVWYFTGVLASPVLRLQGVTFDRGTWEGTAIQIKESMIIVDNDGGVFKIAGGLKRISYPAIEEVIRKAIAYQASHI